MTRRRVYAGIVASVIPITLLAGAIRADDAQAKDRRAHCAYYGQWEQVPMQMWGTYVTRVGGGTMYLTDRHCRYVRDDGEVRYIGPKGGWGIG